MSTLTITSKNAEQQQQEQQQRRDKALDVSISMNESILKAIDATRGDTNRSLWLRRLAIKELQRLKEEREEKLQGAEVSASHQAATSGVGRSSSPTTTTTAAEEAGQQPPLIKEEDHSLA